jgi:uncharacterized protein YceK
MQNIILVVLAAIVLSGCAGTGFNKQATLMPDELSISVDADPDEHWQINEVTGGAKWKLQ